MDALIDGRGGRLDLMVRHGTDMPTIELTLTNEDGTPLDLTGATLVARGTTRSDAPVSMNLVAAVSGPATAGVVTLDMSVAEIARMTPPTSVSSAPRVGADWSLDMTVGERTTPLLFGEVYVAAGPGTVS